MLTVPVSSDAKQQMCLLFFFFVLSVGSLLCTDYQCAPKPIGTLPVTIWHRVSIAPPLITFSSNHFFPRPNRFWLMEMTVIADSSDNYSSTHTHTQKPKKELIFRVCTRLTMFIYCSNKYLVKRQFTYRFAANKYRSPHLLGGIDE